MNPNLGAQGLAAMVFVKVVFAETDTARGGTLPEKEKG